MALQPNPFGFMSERFARRHARQLKIAPRVQQYTQPWLIPDSPCDWTQEVMERQSKTDPAMEQPTAPTIENLSAFQAQNPWSMVVVGIENLMGPSEKNEDEPATEHAYRTARAVVESAYGRLWSDWSVKKTFVPNIPSPVVVTDDRGGVKLAWQQGTKHVRVNFGAAPESRSYLYFESAAEHGVEDLQPSNLSRRLDWLLTP